MDIRGFLLSLVMIFALFFTFSGLSAVDPLNLSDGFLKQSGADPIGSPDRRF